MYIATPHPAPRRPNRPISGRSKRKKGQPHEEDCPLSGPTSDHPHLEWGTLSNCDGESSRIGSRIIPTWSGERTTASAAPLKKINKFQSTRQIRRDSSHSQRIVCFNPHGAPARARRTGESFLAMCRRGNLCCLWIWVQMYMLRWRGCVLWPYILRLVGLWIWHTRNRTLTG